MGFEEGDPPEGWVKNMPVACFLARGKVHFRQSAVRRTVNWQKSLPCTAKASFGMSFIFIRWRDLKDQIAACRWQAAATSSKTGGYIYFLFPKKKKMQTSPALRTPAARAYYFGRYFMRCML